MGIAWPCEAVRNIKPFNKAAFDEDMAKARKHLAWHILTSKRGGATHVDTLPPCAAQTRGMVVENLWDGARGHIESYDNRDNFHIRLGIICWPIPRAEMAQFRVVPNAARVKVKKRRRKQAVES